MKTDEWERIVSIKKKIESLQECPVTIKKEGPLKGCPTVEAADLISSARLDIPFLIRIIEKIKGDIK